ncbi:hypothetical protein WMW72_01495 [Paenibacillus filicis]|uniref:Uncharacterized protein n=1 Tax=Paenibacillus filicis TaxID=669464 RepID=A0ABU9DCJ8_9BACL
MNGRLWGRGLLVAMLASGLLLSGCGQERPPRTVIIPDTPASSGTEPVNEDFAVRKIYTFPEPGAAGGPLLGWADSNQLLGLYGRYPDRSLDRVDYRLGSQQPIMKLGASLEGAELSPDGRFVVYVKAEDAVRKVMLLDWSTQQETFIQEVPRDRQVATALAWSGNGQYLGYGLEGRIQNESRLILYDMAGKSLQDYPIPAWASRDMSYGLQIADNGQSALLVKSEGRQSKLVYGQLTGEAFVSQYELPASAGTAFGYLHDDQILFASAEGALLSFDRRNRVTSTLLERVGTFRLSPDRKYIAYTKGQDEIFVAKLQGNAILNEKSIYKGLIPFQIDWSPDDKKILLSGRKPYSREEPGPVSSGPATAAQSSIPFIIEFSHS